MHQDLDLVHEVNALERERIIVYKSLHYRLLIPLITDLVNTKHFVAALHYRNKFQYSGSEDFYADILDGSIAKEHLDSMDKNNKAWCIEKPANSESTPINLLLSQFYDGGRGESAMTSSEIRFKSTNRHLTSSDIL